MKFSKCWLAMLGFDIVSDYDRKNWLKGFSVHIDKSTACEIYCHCLSIDLLNHTESYKKNRFARKCIAETWNHKCTKK